MKLLIDFQACQAETRNRGIGRYAFGLLKEFANKGKLAEATLHLNTTIMCKNDPLLNEILDLSPKTNVVCESYFPMDIFEYKDRNRELNVIKFSNIASNYDGVFIIDPMEAGNWNFTPNSRNHLPHHIWCGAVIHDFIPLIYRDLYLSNPEASRIYHRKLQLIRTCDCLLANSEHTRKDAISLLGIPPSKVVNISGGVEPMFKIVTSSLDNLQFLGIKRDYILYLAANGPHKNISGAINAFALLPSNLKDYLQLVIACKLENDVENYLKKHAIDVGLHEDSVVFTGFVSDEALVKLYNSAILFIFTSLYEGLGFPILEAIRCGAPVLAGDNSSQPEAVGTEDALFNSNSPQSIADKIEYSLNNPKWLKKLKERQIRHAENFTWNNSAEKAWTAIENSYVAFRKKHFLPYAHSRPRIAWFMPLLPQKSGIDNYNANLIPHLMQNYDIDLVINSDYSIKDDYLCANCNILCTDEFEVKHLIHAYDQCVYQLGNSNSYVYMFSFIKKYGGTVIMHEVYLDEIAASLESQNSGNASFLLNAYSYSPELVKQKELFEVNSAEYSHIRTIALLSHILNNADGVLVHSKHASNMLLEMLPTHSCPITVSELGTSLPALLSEHEKIQLRNKLGIEDDKTVCSAFGIIKRFMGTEDIIEALCRLSQEIKRRIIFLFVGACCEGHEKWLDELLFKASLAGLDVRTTGNVDDRLFSDYVNVSDVALDLRTFTRGESSTALLQLMSCGIPSIVYNIDFFSEIDDNAVLKVFLSDKEALKNQIERLVIDEELRKSTSKCARDFASRLHWPTRVEAYRDFIYKSIEYKKRVKKYAEIMYSLNRETAQPLTNCFKY